MGKFAKWLWSDRGEEDPVLRDRIKTSSNGTESSVSNFLSKLKDNIQEHPELITAAAGAVGAASSNMSSKDILLLAGVGYLAYRHFENKTNRKELFEGVKENVSEFGGKVLGKAKEAVNEYKQEKAEQKAAFEEQQEILLNPRGYFSEAYTVADVGKFAAEITPTKATNTFKSMTPKDQKEYLEFVDAKDQHRVNYDNAFAKKGVSIYDCAFYDNDGKRVNPFVEINPTDSFNKQMEYIGLNQTAKDAIIHGMDCGYIKCKLPDGTNFDPKKISEIRNDKFSKNQDKMVKLDYKYAEIQADIDTDKMKMINNARMEDIKAAMPKGLSTTDADRFKIEVGGMMAYAKQESDAYCYMVKSSEREYSSPYDTMLKSMGVSIPEERKPKASKEDTAENTSNEFKSDSDKNKNNKFNKDDFADVEDAVFREAKPDIKAEESNKESGNQSNTPSQYKNIIDNVVNAGENMSNDGQDKGNQFE